MTVETYKETDAALIHQLLDDWLAAIQDKDIDRLMSLYLPDIVSYDMIPPLEYAGAEAYRKNWQMGFDCMQSVRFERSELHLTIGTEAAFCYSLNHMSGTDDEGEPFDNWVRWTTCLKKIDGHWRIAHEHISVPIDMDTGLGRMDLKPG